MKAKIFLKAKKLALFYRGHKKVSIAIIAVAVVLIVLAIRGLSKNNEKAEYITEMSGKGSVVVSISGSGQVSSSNEVEIKPKVSSDVVWIGVKNGDEVKKGQALVSLDSTEAKKDVAEAELDLEESKLQFDKSVAEAPIDYARQLESLASSKEDLATEYNDAFNSVSDAFLDLPDIVTGAEDILYGDDLGRSSGQWNVSVYKGIPDAESARDTISAFAKIAEEDYVLASEEYDVGFAKFKTLNRNATNEEVGSFLDSTYLTAVQVAQAIKSEKNLIDTVIDFAGRENKNLDTYITTAQSQLGSYLSSINGVVSSLLSAKRSLENAHDTVLDLERDIEIFLINNPTGVNPVDLQITKNSIKKKEATVEELKNDLSDYVSYAPFAGVIASVDAKVGDSVSSGSTLLTLITKQKIAEITLNEVDAAKVVSGQKAVITFDAVEDVSVVGEVSEIDIIGAVSQGVVTYSAKVSFDIDDERIKPGMSVSVSIITDAKHDVMVVSNSAIKSRGDVYYVEVLNSETGALEEKTVEVGISNDTTTEIISGLNEGDEVVTRTSTSSGNSTTKTSATQNSTLFSMGSGGNTMRMPR